jgi:hypothetical protein
MSCEMTEIFCIPFVSILTLESSNSDLAMLLPKTPLRI